MSSIYEHTNDQENHEEEEEPSYSLYEFYLNSRKVKTNESETKKNEEIEICFWNKLQDDVEDVFDESGFATRPDRRFRHTAVYSAKEDAMYVFGGFVEEGNESQNDFWRFDIPSRSWTEIYPTNSNQVWPSPRMEHCSVMVSLTPRRFKRFENIMGQNDFIPSQENNETTYLHNQMYIFGGYSSQNTQFNNELYCFDFTHSKFFKINYQVTQQLFYLNVKRVEYVKERSRHTMVASAGDEKLYIVGGMTFLSHCLMDVWEYDIDTQTMTCLWQDRNEDQSGSDYTSSREEAQDYPEPRCFHSCVYSRKENSLYMFGGIRRGAKLFQELWKFDISHRIWIAVDMHGFVPVERFEHISFMLNDLSDYLFIYGGYNFRHSYLDYIYQFCLSTKTWIRLQNRNYTVGGKFQSKGSILFVDYNETPISRAGTSCIVTKDYHMIIFGGKSCTLLNDAFVCFLPGHGRLPSVKLEFHTTLYHTALTNTSLSDCYMVTVTDLR
ncbi:hypothetical protein C9374_000789 [Naegleria lovaniensis]|uniref:Uncharacterized protein n=1 Tax=Naegleria lovaniensis TaxID=51637 RepID=A0AA88KNE2_NAELO|nr:uncharacterized protein C9374_000789 [Naegleria lovaniensis]KAG2387939.1 hypothetical protein C9374_000789 [Naegleria lovaniensis]